MGRKEDKELGEERLKNDIAAFKSERKDGVSSFLRKQEASQKRGAYVSI